MKVALIDKAECTIRSSMVLLLHCQPLSSVIILPRKMRRINHPSRDFLSRIGSRPRAPADVTLTPDFQGAFRSPLGVSATRIRLRHAQPETKRRKRSTGNRKVPSGRRWETRCTTTYGVINMDQSATGRTGCPEDPRFRRRSDRRHRSSGRHCPSSTRSGPGQNPSPRDPRSRHRWHPPHTGADPNRAAWSRSNR